MNQNQEELFSELFAYRVVLQDSYENESDIIRELKNYLRDQGFSSSNVPNTLHEFYKTYGIEIPLDTIKQACANNMVNSMLGFMLSHGDFEHAHEHEYENEDDEDEDDNNEEEQDEDDHPDDEDGEPLNHVQMLGGDQLVNMLAQALLQQHQNGHSINGILQQMSSLPVLMANNNNSVNQNAQPASSTSAPAASPSVLPSQSVHSSSSVQINEINESSDNNINSHAHSDVSGDELSDSNSESISDSENSDESNQGPNLQQMASDMLSMNNPSNGPIGSSSMLQFTSFGPGSINGTIQHGIFTMPQQPQQHQQPVIVSPNGPASNPWLNGLNNQPITHESIVSILNNLLSGLNGPSSGPVFINGNLNMGQPFQNVVVSMDDKDIENLKSIKLESTLDTDCSVCMGHMEKDEMVTELKCSHTFHTECIHPYLKQYNYKCPVCRAEVGKAKYNL